MTVGPFAVTWPAAPDPPRVGLVHTTTAYAAAGKWLFRHHRIRKKGERTRLFADRKVRAEPVRPYRSGERHFYARDIDHAVAIAGPRVDPGDHHDCLIALTNTDLILQAHYLWPPAANARISEGVYRYAPAAARIQMLKERYNHALHHTTRRTIATAVCLAIADPTRVPPVPNTYRHPDEPVAPSGPGMVPLKRLHPDVDATVLRLLARAVGPDLSYPADTLALIRSFCEAYGYDPERLRWSEIRALLAGSQAGLDRHRIEGGGRDDFFHDRS